MVCIGIEIEKNEQVKKRGGILAIQNKLIYHATSGCVNKLAIQNKLIWDVQQTHGG